MNDAVNAPGINIVIDAHECTLTPAEEQQIRDDLDGLARQIERFPISDVRVVIQYNARTTDYSVKTTVLLTGTALVAAEHDPVLHAAFQRCLDSLTQNVKAYKGRLGDVAERQKQEKGTRHDLLPDPEPDPAALDAAADAGDYPGFRAALLGYEEPLRKRAGRWVERYPEMNAEIGRKFEVADIVEEVFLTAFEAYPDRPREVRLGEWLEGLLDPAVKELQAHGDAELENIRMARSAVEAEQGPGTV